MTSRSPSPSLHTLALTLLCAVGALAHAEPLRSVSDSLKVEQDVAAITAEHDTHRAVSLLGMSQLYACTSQRARCACCR